MTGVNVSYMTQCQEDYECHLQLSDTRQTSVWKVIIYVTGDNVRNQRNCQEQEKVSGTALISDTEKNARNRRQCQEPEKLSGTGKMAGKSENIRNRRTCQEQAKLSGTGETVTNRRNCQETGEDDRNRRRCQEQANWSGTGETVRNRRNCDTSQRNDTATGNNNMTDNVSDVRIVLYRHQRQKPDERQSNRRTQGREHTNDRNSACSLSAAMCAIQRSCVHSV